MFFPAPSSHSQTTDNQPSSIYVECIPFNYLSQPGMQSRDVILNLVGVMGSENRNCNKRVKIRLESSSRGSGGFLT